MPNSVPTHLSSPALFDVTAAAPAHVNGRTERIALEQLELAPNGPPDLP